MSVMPAVPVKRNASALASKASKGKSVAQMEATPVTATAVAAPPKKKRSRQPESEFVPTPRNMHLSMGAPQPLKMAAESWGAMMTEVRVSVRQSEVVPGMGVLEVRVADKFGICKVASNVEISINHLGRELVDKSSKFMTSHFSDVLKQIVKNGALNIKYDLDATARGYVMTMDDTFSKMEFLVPEQVEIGDESPVKRDVPTSLLCAVKLNVSSFKSFVSFLAKSSELFYIKVQSTDTHIFLTIGADPANGSGVSAAAKFYGLKGVTSSSSSSSHGGGACADAGGEPMLTSTHMLALDESRFRCSAEVASSDNVLAHELKDAQAELDDSPDVHLETHQYMAAFASAFLKGLDLKSKLTLALVDAGGGTSLFLRCLTPKSVLELLIAERDTDDD